MLFCKIILSKFLNSSFRHLNSIPLLKSSHSLGQSLFSAFGTTPLERTVGRLLNKAGTEDCVRLTFWFWSFHQGGKWRNPPHQIHFHIYSPHQQRWLLLVWWPKNRWKTASTISPNLPAHHITGERLGTKLSHSDRGEVGLSLLRPLWLGPLYEVAFGITIASEDCLHLRGSELPG